MKRRLAGAAVLMLAAAACSDQGPTAPPVPSFSQVADGDPIPGRHIVVLRDDLDDVETHARDIVQAHRGTLLHLYGEALKGFSAEIADEEIASVLEDPRVRFVEPDRVIRIRDTQPNPLNWGLDRIDQRALPLDAAYTYPSNAAGVTLYGIDTGILYSHVDFGGRAVPGYDAVTPGGGAVDCDGHGTHTASTAAGTQYGVAKGATIIGVRVLNCFGSGTTSGVIAGVDWVTGNHQAGVPAVANMSLGGGVSASIDLAVANSVADGIVYSVSAGNENLNACFVSPAREPAAITVGATGANDARASFSNFGTCVDIFAPGVGIVAAYIGSNTASASLSGTSMSAPHVAGAALLHLAANPGDTPAQVAAALTSNGTTGVVGSPGSGSPNILLYTGYIGGSPPPPPPPTNEVPVADFTYSCTASLLCTFDGNASSDADGTVTGWTWYRQNGSVWQTVPVFSQQFSTAGVSATVTLSVIDDDGATGSVSRLVTITAGPPPPPPPPNQPPVANFTYSCNATLLCTFDATSSSDSDGTISSWVWYRQNGSVWQTVPVFSQQFSTAGASATITVTVADDDGATSTFSKLVTIAAGAAS